jgi:hypothetical protein
MLFWSTLQPVELVRSFASGPTPLAPLSLELFQIKRKLHMQLKMDVTM